MKSRDDNVYERLRAEISAGNLLPGSRLRQVELAERLGISRTPIREALQRLETEGLVQHVPRIGTIVTKLDLQSIVELYDIREVLEGTAARYASRHASEAEILDLRGFIDSESDYSADFNAMANINSAFHAAIYRASHNRFLMKSLDALSASMVLLGKTTLSVEDRLTTAHHEHIAIVDAIADRNADRAEEAARNHIRSAQKARLKLARMTLVQGT